jgi:hypothetical protein
MPATIGEREVLLGLPALPAFPAATNWPGASRVGGAGY